MFATGQEGKDKKAENGPFGASFFEFILLENSVLNILMVGFELQTSAIGNWNWPLRLGEDLTIGKHLARE